MAAFIMASRAGSSGAAMTAVRLVSCCFQGVLLGRGICEDYLQDFQRRSIVAGAEVPPRDAGVFWIVSVGRSKDRGI